MIGCLLLSQIDSSLEGNMRRGARLTAALAFSVVLGCIGFPTDADAENSTVPVKIGLIVDMSGPYSDFSGPGSVLAARMAIDDFGGKVLDRPIELLSGDHQNKADIASAIAREWFDSQGVDALVDVTGSAAGLAVNELAKARKKIVFYNSAATSRLTNEACGPFSVHYAFDTYALGQRHQFSHGQERF
jgi:branched-chain amino acid transport system substrate-binding protein